MAAKKKRLEMLRSLLQNNAYESQEELLNALAESGFPVAQPTLSRDLRTLKVSKLFTEDGGYAYSLPEMARPKNNNQSALATPYGFESVDFSGNLAVLKTAGGYASMLAGKLDSFESKDIVGTVAGDDTIIVVLREGTSRNIVYNLLRAIVPDFEE